MRAQWMTPPQGYYQRDATYWCNVCHGWFDQKRLLEHDGFHQSYTNRTDGSMSNVLWCDYGDHSFKAGAPGSAHFNGTEVSADGHPETVSMDACALHRPDRAQPQVIAKELERDYPITRYDTSNIGDGGRPDDDR